GVAEALGAQAPGHRLPVVERVADAEALQRLVAEAALDQVRSRAFRLVRLEQHLPVEGDGRLQRLPQPPPAPILAGGALGELDARLLGQPLERLAELEAVALAQEGEDVAVLAAAEAMPRLTLGRDDERRGLLSVEGAESLVHAT